ncbi:flagellar biosynthetic protein FliR [Sphaerotilus sulfidivorans]|uniref:Flagellar biosynthetic protein FliR n=1 Tax=Sphaerotilus sulfidivorans TaxID=639200 RepID=A0A5C1Q2M9_9BURK|nr:MULTISPECIES: flagellar biosynthetic protein FliR [Sphaerotilus]NZD45828.1 flagellar biosynthetic protein FliR [Sphaerotilus sulfidivorans]QEN01688.1 flagellar biosynthetic protein FliR [Sphaerotilus sulfidivorans]GKQ56264.1 flagellar biosynthetic protein FliR [Sphaerotilus sp. FB-3]
MIGFSEAQLLQWIVPLLWPLLRILGLFAAAPVLSMRVIPVRARIGLALLTALCAQPVLPPMPVLPLDTPTALAMVVQQVFIGVTIGFAAKVVFTAIEFAGEVIGLQMGLNFATFFDPTTSGQSTVSARLFNTMAAWLFVVINGHLLLVEVVVASFHQFPVTDHPFDLLLSIQPQVWGAELFRYGLWIALPTVAMLLFVNLVLGVISRVAQQLQIFSIGFVVTISVGLLGLLLTLPLLQRPMLAVLERLLGLFQP